MVAVDVEDRLYGCSRSEDQLYSCGRTHGLTRGTRESVLRTILTSLYNNTNFPTNQIVAPYRIINYKVKKPPGFGAKPLSHYIFSLNYSYSSVKGR